MHRQEILKPTNTGRLIADVYPEQARYFEWHRTQPDPALICLLDDDYYLPVLIFPQEYVDPNKVCSESKIEAMLKSFDSEHESSDYDIEKLGESNNSAVRKRQLLFVILDGTWAQCKKMYKNSDYLKKLACLHFTPSQESCFNMRKAPEKNHLCTVEVAIELLRLNISKTSERILAHYYQVFNQHYIASRKTTKIDYETESHRYLKQQ